MDTTTAANLNPRLPGRQRSRSEPRSSFFTPQPPWPSLATSPWAMCSRAPQLGVLQALGRIELAVGTGSAIEDPRQRRHYVFVVVQDLVVVPDGP